MIITEEQPYYEEKGPQLPRTVEARSFYYGAQQKLNARPHGQVERALALTFLLVEQGMTYDQGDDVSIILLSTPPLLLGEACGARFSPILALGREAYGSQYSSHPQGLYSAAASSRSYLQADAE